MRLLPVLLLVCAIVEVAPARASERRFTYTYESLTLPAGQIELEPWTTWRYGREDFYSRFDERLELEVGLTDWLQTSLYLNATFLAEDEAGKRVQETEFGGISSEWKAKILDPVADPVGLALYAEGTLSQIEGELEGKVIVDKRFGDFIAAFNGVAEYELEWEEIDELEQAIELEADLGLAYLVTKELGIGLELRNVNEIKLDEGFEHSVLFAGPSLSYAGERFWATLTVMPQIVQLYGHEGELQNLEDHERLETRLIFGVHL